MGDHVAGREKAIPERKKAGRCRKAQRAIIAAGSILAMVLLVGSMVSPLCAQSYPNKPIRFILPMAPGGVTDILGRIIGQKLAARLGQPVVPESRGGAGGNVGYELVATARPDGYTLILGSGGLATSPSLYKKLNYDPDQGSHADLARRAGPCRGSRPSIQAVYDPEGARRIRQGQSRETQFRFERHRLRKPPYRRTAQEPRQNQHRTRALQRRRSGADRGDGRRSRHDGDRPYRRRCRIFRPARLKALAVLSHERLPSLPNVPTAKEAGIDNFEVSNWYGILAPGGTPRDIVSRLNAEWIRIVAMPDTKEQLQKAGFEPLSCTPEQFAEFLKAEIERWAKVIKEANIPRLD